MTKPRVRKCRGVITSNDRRERPLVRCAEVAIPGEDYCTTHIHEHERQTALRRYLKPGWERGVIAGRGREPREVNLPPIEELGTDSAVQPPAPATPARPRPILPRLRDLGFGSDSE